MRRAPILLALLLTVPTGASGLIYEVTWQRYLATLLGSQAASVALVLGVFLGSLALGYALFGRLAQTIVRRSTPDAGPRRLLACYAGAEAAIGAYAVLFPRVFEVVRRGLLARPDDALSPAFDLAATLLLIAPPTLLMGATVPLLTQALPRSLDQATRIHAWVYGLNTLGAVAGALGAAFVLIPSLGLDGTMKLAGTVNQAAAVVYAFLALFAVAGVAPAPAAPSDPQATQRTLLLGALLLGAGMMTLQVVANRMGALSLGASVFTFAMVAAVFVLCIALGSLAVSLSSRWPTRLVLAVPWLLAASVLVLHPVVDDAPYWAHRLRVRFGSGDADFFAFHVALLMGLLGPLGIPAFLSGAALPLLFHELRRRQGELGRVAGRLYAWNTLGSLLGACGLGYLALHWLDLDGVYRLAAAGLVAAAAILHAGLSTASSRKPIALAALLLAGVALLPGWEPGRLASGLYRERTARPETDAGPAAFFAAHGGPARFLFYADGPDTSVAVGEHPRPDGRFDRNIVVNGKSDGLLIGEYRTRAMSALVPALFARNLQRAFVVGYGTGVSAAELAALEPAPGVDVAEISREVLRAAPFFDYANLGASIHPAIHVRHADAFRALTRSAERYDVIVSEPSNPWLAGTEMLYSREFYVLARAKLRPGGVFGQWIHTYELDAATLELALRTFASVFDHVAVWYTGNADLLLVGTGDTMALADLERLRRRALRPDFQAGLRRAGVRGLPGLLAHELLPEGIVQSLEPGPIHTLGRPLLGDGAARAFFRNDAAHLPALLQPGAVRRGSEASLLGQARRSLQDPNDPAFWWPLLHEACALSSAQCATLLASRRAAGERSPELALLVAQLRSRPELEPFLGEDQLARLESLFAPVGVPAGVLSVEEVLRRTQLYAEGFVYGMPFRREALVSQWRRCRPADECRAAQRRAEAVLGPLSR